MSVSRLRATAVVAQHEEGGVVYLAPLPDGPITVLQGTAAAIWREAQGRSRADVVRSLARDLDTSAPSIEGDVNAFIDVLIESSLLREQVGRPPRT